MNILLTGGAGYIGTHTAVELMAAGHHVTILDNLSNSSRVSVARVGELAQQTVPFHHIDMLDQAAVDDVFASTQFDAVVHFAGLKAVGESVRLPMQYYRTNLVSTINLVEAMARHGVPRLVFSSSATVYGEPASLPITEEFPVHDAASPYGRTKLMIERILEDAVRASDELAVSRLRYFNPCGAHESGIIGEDPQGIPNNLIPFISQVAVGRREKLIVNGDDYPTPDGTCIRDYIHVLDLAAGHLAALEKLEPGSGVATYNLGSGTGTSVFEMISAFESANNLTIPREVGPRRDGDIPASYTDAGKAFRELGWRTERSIDDMCRDTWKWQQQNPNGYGDD